jgi:glycosyltransferase involved in cell wall biosynthesis
MSDIALFYFLKEVFPSGMTTFTAQLFEALKTVGHRPYLYRVKEDADGRVRRFGQFRDVDYACITPTEARGMVKHVPSIMTASARITNFPFIHQLLKDGMRAVLHDPTEFRNLEPNGGVPKLPQPPICIRKAMLKYYPEGTFIPHPYKRQHRDDVDRKRPLRAVSVARVVPMKRPTIILDANRMLPKPYRVQMLGEEYRLYSYGLQKKYGDVFEQKKGPRRWPSDFTAILARARYQVDMTKLEGDGGGTGYAILEAMDAGCINVLHRDWFDVKGSLMLGKHALAVKDAEELALLLRSDLVDRDIIENGYQLLKRHDPKIIGTMFAGELL